ncbi:MAG: YisL family protein [Ectobacillus sp.]
MTHAHITAWAVGIILFFVAYAMYGNKSSKAKMVHMIARLMYVAIIITGFLLYQSIMKTATGDMHMWYGIKMLIGLWVIGAMEIVLMRTNKGKSANAGWIQFVIALLVVLYLGLKLPLGFAPLA